MVDKTAKFNSLFVSAGLNDQLLRILRRQLGQANWKKITYFSFKFFMGQLNISKRIFYIFEKNIFEEIEKLNDTKMHSTHQSWALRDHHISEKWQWRCIKTEKKRTISTHSKWVLFLSLKKNNWLLLWNQGMSNLASCGLKVFEMKRLTRPVSSTVFLWV